MRSTTVRDLQQDGTLDREPCRVEMAPGDTMVCVRGLAWVTMASRNIECARRDVVLAVGERFAARRAIVVFVSALGSAPAGIALHRYARGASLAATPVALNAGSVEAASSSSMSA